MPCFRASPSFLAFPWMFFSACHSGEYAGFVGSNFRPQRDQICIKSGPEVHCVRQVDKRVVLHRVAGSGSVRHFSSVTLDRPGRYPKSKLGAIRLNSSNSFPTLGNQLGRCKARPSLRPSSTFRGCLSAPARGCEGLTDQPTETWCASAVERIRHIEKRIRHMWV